MFQRRKFLVTGLLGLGGTVAGVYVYRSIPTASELVVTEAVGELAKLPAAVRFGDRFMEEMRVGGQAMETLAGFSRRLVAAHGEFSSDDIGKVLEERIQEELSRSDATNATMTPCAPQPREMTSPRPAGVE